MATFVLIPGAGGDPWTWHRLAPELEARGHEALPVRMPAGDESAGWIEYANAIEAAMGSRTDVTLVAQSLAGFSAPMVAARRPIHRLVLLNAMIPAPGETGNEWWSNTDARAAQLEYIATIGLEPEDTDEVALIYFHDAPPEVRELALRREFVQSMTPMDQPWPLEAWPDVPTRVLVAADDRLFPASFQRDLARERLGLDVEEIPGGHLVALSRPRELADRLEALAAG